MTPRAAWAPPKPFLPFDHSPLPARSEGDPLCRRARPLAAGRFRPMPPRSVHEADIQDYVWRTVPPALATLRVLSDAARISIHGSRLADPISKNSITSEAIPYPPQYGLRPILPIRVSRRPPYLGAKWGSSNTTSASANSA